MKIAGVEIWIMVESKSTRNTYLDRKKEETNRMEIAL